MSSTTQMAYRSACESTAFFHDQNELIHSNPLWVRDNLTSSEQMEAYAKETFDRIDQCREPRDITESCV